MMEYKMINDYDEMMRERYICLKTALLDLTAIQYDYADCGAKDTSVDNVLQGMIWAAYNDVKPEIFVEPRGYRLYDEKGSKECAKKLAKKMAEIIDLLLSFGYVKPANVDYYVKAYCYRVWA